MTPQEHYTSAEALLGAFPDDREIAKAQVHATLALFHTPVEFRMQEPPPEIAPPAAVSTERALIGPRWEEDGFGGNCRGCDWFTTRCDSTAEVIAEFDMHAHPQWDVSDHG